jgi:hypothetical protein
MATCQRSCERSNIHTNSVRPTTGPKTARVPGVLFWAGFATGASGSGGASALRTRRGREDALEDVHSQCMYLS